MLHFKGQADDFETWSHDYNLSSWHWKAVRPFLQAGSSQPQDMLTLARDYSRLTMALHEAAEEFEGHKAWRFRTAQYNIKNGLRHSVYQRFLQPVIAQNRGNLHVITQALAKRIELESVGGTAIRRVSSVIFRHGNSDFSVLVRKQLILSAGAYQSPQLLLVSGIGNATELRRLHIEPQMHSPQVGKRLHDHFNLPLYVSMESSGPTLNQRTLFDPMTLLRYLHNGAGPLGNFGVLGHMDVAQAMLTFFGAGAIDEAVLMSISNFERSHFRALFPRYYNASQEGFVLISTCLQPKSRGTVHVSSADIRRQPLIDPNYLESLADVNCTIRALRAAVEVVMSQAFVALQPRLHWPRLKACANFGPFERDFHTNMPTARYLECIMRHVGLGSHHPAGSCAMGTNPTESVVDAEFRFHGIENMRIVDASVLPTPISGNPNSIIVGMAVRAATMILKDELGA